MDNLGIDVGDLEVIDVPADGALHVMYDLVGDAWVVAGTICVMKEDGTTNLADVLIKLLSQVAKELLCNKFMY
jgi:hypothetical protein